MNDYAGAVREARNRNLRDELGEKENNSNKVSVRVFEEEDMDEDDTPGRSADKALGAEDEGSTAPLPEKVILVSHLFSVV